MNSVAHKLILITAAFIFFTLQPSVLRAGEADRGIGGTGHTAIGGMGGTGHTGSGIGGTGSTANKTGIGGTGHAQSDGGIGGTGIVGIITGFGSIWVNGLEVQYDAKTQMADNNEAVSTNELAIGQVVAIEASGSNHEFRANKISLVNAVEGPISAIDISNGKLTVLGQTVVTTTQTLIGEQPNTRRAISFSPGDYVKVSGLRMANGEVMASRVERTGPIAEPGLVGPITRINGNMIEVYGLQISSTTAGSAFNIGQEISVTGQLNGGILTARSMTLSPSMQLYGHTAHINLQGYVGAATSDGQIKIGNMEIEMSDPSVATTLLSPGQLVQISGRFANDHRVIADRIEISRDRPDSVPDSIGGHEQGGMDSVEHGDHAERPDRNDHVDRPDSPERSDHAEVPNQSEHSH